MAKADRPREAETPPGGRGEQLLVLPCSGLDKEAGAVSRDLALLLGEYGAVVVCPVLYQRVPERYRKDLEGGRLLVVDGCKTGCASKLAAERGLKIARRLTVSEALEVRGLKPGKEPRVSEAARALVPGLAESLLETGGAPATASAGFDSAVSLMEFTADKFIFRVPESGYFFNENDCWARVAGDRARIGVSDYLQQSASDMVLFEPPELGARVEIFDEVGSLETTKTSLDIISPAGGTVVAFNQEVVEAPELINADPYVNGWSVEIELSDFESDRGLLMDCNAYFTHLQAKVSRELAAKQDGGKEN